MKTPIVLGFASLLAITVVYYVVLDQDVLTEGKPRIGTWRKSSDYDGSGASEIELYFIAVAAMQRCASTGFLYHVLNESNACFVPLNELFNRGPNQAGDAWAIEGEQIDYDSDVPYGRGIRRHEDVVKFARNVALRRCKKRHEHLKKEGLSHMCNNKCIVGFKEFDEHLKRDQHSYLWNHLPNLTVAVLERSVNDRWKSIWVAAQDGDWDTNGSESHKQKLVSSEIPPVNESSTACKTKAFVSMKLQDQSICNFEQTHNSWYDYVRHQNPERVEVDFSDVVVSDGAEAMRKMRSALQRKYSIEETIVWKASNSTGNS
mmetsp:Transcript_2938/g.4020  ORF Transcript_2938/g.4020 Transcript_2938/m.4020 type:complete len:317 (-) Transcript_2938:66-1016(-)